MTNTQFSHGGRLQNFLDMSETEFADVYADYRTRANNNKYMSLGDNFDDSIFVHRLWCINQTIIMKGLNYALIVTTAHTNMEKTLESAEHEPELVRERIRQFYTQMYEQPCTHPSIRIELGDNGSPTIVDYNTVSVFVSEVCNQCDEKTDTYDRTYVAVNKH